MKKPAKTEILKIANKKLVNISKNLVLAKNIYFFDKLFPSLFGILLIEDFSKEDVALFEVKGKNIIIHTFFLKFPIDILVLNENLVVIDKKLDVKPNRIVLARNCYYFLEFISGKEEVRRTEIGDKLAFV